MRWADMIPAKSLVTPPASEPLTYAQVRALLRLENDADEAWLTGVITASRMKLEQDTGLMLPTQTWDVCIDAFPSDAIRPPCCPLQSVTSITTTSAAGAASVLASTQYQVDTLSKPPRIVLSDAGSWPSDLRATQAITIRCVAGYASAAAIEKPLISALEQLITAAYHHRTAQPSMIPPRWLWGYDEIIKNVRLWGIA